MTNAAPNPPRIANAPDTSLANTPAPVFGAAVGLALELEPALVLTADAADVMALLAREETGEEREASTVFRQSSVACLENV